MKKWLKLNSFTNIWEKQENPKCIAKTLQRWNG